MLEKGAAMRDVIEKVIATEGEARQIVETAKNEADRIWSEVQKKAQEIVERARREARAEAEAIVAAAVEEAEREKQDRLARAATEIENQVQLGAEDRRSAVEGVVRCVCRQR
jgi:vacuolar-type H+-ATPase subunit H